MVNQDPQPEYFTTTHDFDVTSNSGVTNIATIFTNQSNNEQVTIYGFGVDITALDSSGNNLSVETVTNPFYYNYVNPNNSPFGVFTDFNLELLVGGNQIPTQDIELQRFLMPGSNPQPYIAFSSPVLVLYQQPLQIQIVANDNIAAHDMVSGGTDVATVRVRITLIAQNEIQKMVV